jgi:hypothetical protein
MSLTVNVTLKGPLFTEVITDVVERSIIDQSLHKFEPRLARGGKGIGARRNTITQDRQGLTLEATSTLRPPRTKGKAWLRKNEGVVRGMAPRVLRATAKRIAEQL